MPNPIYSEKALQSNFWSERMETMSREELDALHLKRVCGLMRYAYNNVPMYRELYDKVGFKPEDVKTLADYINKVPSIDKKELVEYQSRHGKFGDAVVTDSEDYISYLFTTTGTTGKPVLEPGYYKDIQNLWTPMFWAHGIRPKDVFYLAFGFGTFMALWSAYYDALLMGCQVITGGGLDTKTRIRQIMDLKPTVLAATPTYALHMAEVAREMGVDPSATSVRYVVTGGEAGSVVPSIREAMEQAWGARALDLYGISELWGATSMQCPVERNYMHFVETSAFPVVLDAEGQPVAEGQTGEMVITSYGGSVQPLIKYRTHDIVELHREPCGCGRTWVRIRGGVLGRTDHMVVMKGVNIYPTAILMILGENRELTENIEIHVNSGRGGDEVRIKVEPVPGASAADYHRIQIKAIEELRARIGVTIAIEVVEPKSLPRYEMKARRIFDNRPQK